MIGSLPIVCEGEAVPQNTTCLVWRHARWFVVRENKECGAMFDLKPTDHTDVKVYLDDWNHATHGESFAKDQGGKYAAIKWMENHLCG